MLLGLVGTACGDASKEHLGVTANPLVATIYYVSQSGNDSNPGTSMAQAWKTLDAVYMKQAHGTPFNPGDQILLRRGDSFSGTLLLANISGSSQSPIVVGAYGEPSGPHDNSAPKPIITAGGQQLVWQSVNQASHPYCFQAKIAPESHPNGNKIEKLYFDNLPASQVNPTTNLIGTPPSPASLDSFLSELPLSGNGTLAKNGSYPYAYFCKDQAILSELPTKVRAFYHAILVEGSSHLVIQDIEVAQAYNAVTIHATNPTVHCSDITLRRMDLHDTIHFAVNLASVYACWTDLNGNQSMDPNEARPCASDISILDSWLHDGARDEIYMRSAANVRISGNDLGPVVDQVQNCCMTGGDQSLIGVRATSGLTIDHNRMHDTPIHAPQDANQISAIDVSEQAPEVIDHVNIHHNYIFNTVGPGTLKGRDLSFHHNIFIGRPNQSGEAQQRLNGVSLHVTGGGASSVYNNVMYGVAGTVAGLIVNTQAPTYVLNNIVYAVNPTAQFAYASYSGLSLITSRNNAYYSSQNPNTTPIRVDGVFKTLAEAKALGLEARTEIVNPMFATMPATTATDLRLGVSSTLFGKGVDPKTVSAIALSEPSLAFDIAGTIPSFDAPWAKEGAGFDIGAFEATDSEPVSLASGLVLSDHFDERALTTGQTSLVDASGYNFHGIPYGAVSPTAGAVDGAMDLDGASGRMEYGTLGGWNPTAFTLSFWMKSVGAGPGGTPRIMSRKFTIDYYPTTDKVNFEIGATGTNSSATTATLPEGFWYHVVCTYDDVNDRRARVFVKRLGDPLGSKTEVVGDAVVGAMVNQANQFLLIGKHTSQSNYFKGQLDELNIWNRKLSAAEVDELFSHDDRIVQASPSLAILSNTSPNFVLLPTANYGSVTGATANIPASAKGANLVLTGSGWKRVLFSYPVTAKTHLAFSFRSTAQGEIQGIGLDTDDTTDPIHTIQLYGTQAYGQQIHANYAGHASAGWQDYDVAVGSLYGAGSTSRIFFANQGAGAISEFSNVYLYEAP
jgi:hypothetical protein